MDELLVIKDLEKTFQMNQMNDEKKIIGCKGINLTIRTGEFVGITGESGAGKSTILKSIYRTYTPTKGCIHYQSNRFGMIDLVRASDRKMIAVRKNEIGYVSQFLHAMPRITALKMVMDAIVEMGEDINIAEQKAKDILTHFRLPSALWDSFPRTFSGGEKLRLNLAKAMVKRPKLLLLDEPTASLDHQSKQSVKEMIIQLKKEGTTMIGIFHDLDFMEEVVDQSYMLANGQMEKRLMTHG
ncbi:ATP-binding cassette domain-containing protein [Gracilibacillus sp. YIM 98692]|uniref:phosphonate C-P lyase system protein PhnL n=1 Tax=Gracilibacillus sp. YIM 98692 TaxID=2663532 RepID=UPI0013D60615|nr:ATP-binding cassette domain-containing protein [Gracilibacillus sp. YIM 98692]